MANKNVLVQWAIEKNANKVFTYTRVDDMTGES